MKKPKQKLTVSQRKRLVKIVVVLLLGALVWLIIAPGMGFLSWHERNSRLVELQAQKEQLEKENADLQSEIDRIENDIEYFEKLAREKHGLLKKNEVLFDFSKEPRKKESKK